MNNREPSVNFTRIPDFSKFKVEIILRREDEL
jgi:hypothetical protein